MSATISDLHAALVHPSLDLKRVVDVISRDPSLAAQVLRLANSDMEYPAQQKWSVCECVVLVGVRELISLVLRLENLESRSADPARATALYQHSRLAALLAERIAIKFGEVDPLQAYLSGLLHDIGWIPLLAHNQVPQPEHNQMLDAGEAGMWLATEWNLPRFVVGAIGACSGRQTACGSALQSCVAVANYFCEVFGFGMLSGTGIVSDADAYIECAMPGLDGRQRLELQKAVEKEFVGWVRSPINVLGALPSLRNRSEVQ